MCDHFTQFNKEQRNMKRNRLVVLVVMGLSLALLLTLASASVTAHEGREVGKYEIETGWRVEPAYTNLLNGPEFTITEHEGGPPVEGLEDTLKVEVSYGGKSKVLKLRATAGEKGHYTADLIPTQPGDYTFVLTGKIGDQEVNEKFTSTDGKFNTVAPISDIQFP
jgi:hypothetical protein